MDKKYRVLVVNPGSTSDEIALFDGDDEIFHFVSRYSPADLAPYDGKKVTAQYEFRKELVELQKKHKDIFVALTDKRQAETKPAILEFNGTDFDIEIEVKEGVVFPLKARISVTVKVINKSDKEVVLENIGREFLFTLLVRDMADNELLELAGNELDTPVNLTIKPGEVYTENITFNINTDTPMCAKLVFQTVTFNYNGNPTFYMMPPLHVILK